MMNITCSEFERNLAQIINKACLGKDSVPTSSTVNSIFLTVAAAFQGVLTAISNRIPFLHWLPNYQQANLEGDLNAGLTVGIMLVPQAMAYAMLAGLPPIMGLYASTIPLLLYALMGSSTQLAVGPVAIVSLMVASGVGQFAEPGSAQFVAMAVLLAGMVGVIQFLMGILRAGYIVNFLSHPVISGFTSAAALVIGINQLKHMLGISIPRSSNIFTILGDAWAHLGDINFITLFIGAASIAGLLWFRRWKPRFPGMLVIVIGATVFVWLFNLHTKGVAIVGVVPGGLPFPSFPDISGETIQTLLPTAILISLVGFMESISVAKALASKKRQRIDASQELIGLGLANIGSSLFSGYAVTGGFSRSAVNAKAGANTALASVITAGLIILTLIFLTSLFCFLPKAVLAAIIMVAVFGLIDLKEVKHLYHVNNIELGLLIFTFLCTLFLGIEEGILLGVGASLLLFIVRTTSPHYAIMGQLPGTNIFRNLKRYPEATTFPGLLILRIDVSFYFANVEFLKDQLNQIGDAEHIRYVIIDASSVNYMDSSADTAMHEILDNLETRDIQLVFANVKGPVLDMMKRTGLYEQVGAEKYFLRLEDAVDYVRSQAGFSNPE